MGQLDLGSGKSLPLYLDPDSFDSAVYGVVLTYDSLTSLLNSLKNAGTDGSGLGDSAVASACADFNRAWVAETELTAKAVGTIVELLPRVKRRYQDVDQDGGTSVDRGYSDGGVGSDAGGVGIGGVVGSGSSTKQLPSVVHPATEHAGRPPSR